MASLQCPQCGSRNVININLTVEGDRELAFYSCHACDRRWWHDASGELVELPDVLQMARRQRPGAR